MVYHRSSEESSSHQEVKPKNAFRNDGSFLEMFKKLQETSTSSSSDSTSSSSSSSLPKDTPSSKIKIEGNVCSVNDGDSIKPAQKVPIFGKRRGGKALPTGKVKKLKAPETQEDQEEPKGAWSQYLAEVKKYKETTCEEEGKTRPLVK